MAEFGETIVCVAAVLSAAGGGLALLGCDDPRRYRAASGFLYAAAAAGGLALLSLVFLLVIHDYRVEYVREYADRTMSLGFLITAVWGGQDGSLLLWAVLQTWFTAAAAAWLRGRDPARAPVALGFLCALQVFFLLLVLFHSNPFEPLGTTATRGLGINPLLRNPYMVFHPPTLYLGFVGFSVPMALTVAALAHGRLDGDWMTEQRPWILVAWIFLTVGNLLGMVWAYEELGWGGYWGWDPVENASLMPWLTGTALVHSILAEERRGVLRRWNVVLVVLTFALVVFGTLLTRSGIVESVHAFAGATTGPYLVGLIAVAGLLPAGLMIYRLPALGPRKTGAGALSRETMLAAANWVLLAAAAFVWIATMLPAFTELVRDEKVAVTPAFFDRWMVPVGLVILALSVLCTVVGWRPRPGRSPTRRLAIPGLAGAAALALCLATGAAPSVTSALALALLVAAGAAVLGEIRTIALSARSEARTGAALWRRLGGQIAHLAVIALFAGFAGAAYDEEAQASLGRGDAMLVDDYRVRLLDLRFDSDVEREAVFADLEVDGPGAEMVVLSPARFTYHSHPGQPTSEVVIRSRLSEDLFLILGEHDLAGGRAVIRAVVNPLVSWIWYGGALLVLGAVVALIRPSRMASLVEMPSNLRRALARPAGGAAAIAAIGIAVGAAAGLAAGIAAAGGGLLLAAVFFLGEALYALAPGPEARP